MFVLQDHFRRFGVARQRRRVYDLGQFSFGVGAAFEFGHVHDRVELAQPLVLDRQQSDVGGQIVAFEPQPRSVVDALQHGFGGLDFARRERQRFHAGSYSIAVMLVATNCVLCV